MAARRRTAAVQAISELIDVNLAGEQAAKVNRFGSVLQEVLARYESCHQCRRAQSTEFLLQLNCVTAAARGTVQTPPCRVESAACVD